MLCVWAAPGAPEAARVCTRVHPTLPRAGLEKGVCSRVSGQDTRKSPLSRLTWATWAAVSPLAPRRTMARTEERLTVEKNTLSEGSSSHRAFKRRRAKVPFASQNASMRPGLESETGEKRASVTANPIPLTQDTVLSGWNAK